MYDGSCQHALFTHKYTGKERDSESGLDEFGARYYSSALGRFTIPDWAATAVDVPYADFGNPQSLNLYSYVKNNPLNATDPDGHCDSNDWCGSVAGVAVGTYNFVKNTASAVYNSAREYAGSGSETGMAVTALKQAAGTLESVAYAADQYSTKGVSGVGSDLAAQGREGATEIATEAVLTGGLAATSRVNSVFPEGTVTRYMGPGEATTATRTGEIPSTNAAGEARPTHVTTDRPMNSAAGAQAKYELPNTPSHRATVPTGRAGQLGPTPDGRPTTSGGGSQAATNKPIPVKPSEIKKLKD